jgi:hypothetical protein
MMTQPALPPSTSLVTIARSDRPVAHAPRLHPALSGASIAAGGLLPSELAATPDTLAVRASLFAVRYDAGAIVSLKRVADAFDTEYVQSMRRLGDAIVRYRRGAGNWETLTTASFTDRAIVSSPDGARHTATYRPAGADFELRIDLHVEETALRWSIDLENLGATPLEIGDLALPLPMNGNFQQQPTTAVLKHGFISGDGSFLFWMRRNSVGPYLTMTPDASTSLEYWESAGGYRVFIHSAAAGEAARQGGTRWRQPNTSVSLGAREAQSSTRRYGFKLQWAPDYDGVRQILVREGLIDVHVVPGMTVPRDLFARFALRTTSSITSVTAEFPNETTIRPLGRNGDASIYEVRFAKLGENRLTVAFGDGGRRRMHLEFFSTEPVETMIAKRAAFIASHQHRDPAKWYNGLLAEWAMDTKVMLGPDNYDRIRGWRIYEVTCDDPGLSKPAFLASKNAEHPVQSEVSALDYYIEHFVWGGLQRTTDEEYPYAIYGIPDWKQNRGSADPGRNGRKHIWRIYDYPHIALMYFGMYRIAKDYPGIKTTLRPIEYLRRAHGTAAAMFTIPYEVERWSAYQTGLYNELVIPQIIDALEGEGLRDQADRLRMHWDRKVRAFIVDRPDLFRSEYAFDSTGFESTHALVKYALANAERLGQQRPAAERMPPVPLAGMQQFLEQQIQANIFCRGWLETAYYLYGSDYRGSGGNSYTLTYMSSMGGWGVLDYALHHATDYTPYLRLGYASSLSLWALLNSGTSESNYGYWYPGKENDGGAGGGFEPAPFGNTWLEQPHHRGSWYYSCEIDLGFCGALRCARTVLADDPIFGRFCYGGEMRTSGSSIAVIPRDGVRRRFHALIGGRKLHVALDNDRFARDTAITVREDLREVRFEVESENPAPHRIRLRISGRAGGYTLSWGDRTLLIPATTAAEELIDVSVAGSRVAMTLTAQAR